MADGGDRFAHQPRFSGVVFDLPLPRRWGVCGTKGPSLLGVLKDPLCLPALRDLEAFIISNVCLVRSAGVCQRMWWWRVECCSDTVSGTPSMSSRGGATVYGLIEVALRLSSTLITLFQAFVSVSQWRYINLVSWVLTLMWLYCSELIRTTGSLLDISSLPCFSSRSRVLERIVETSNGLGSSSVLGFQVSLWLYPSTMNSIILLMVMSHPYSYRQVLELRTVSYLVDFNTILFKKKREKKSYHVISQKWLWCKNI